MAKKPKLDLSPTGAALHNPFAALTATGLPDGPATPAPAPGEPKLPRPSKYGRVVLRREKAHRGGKTVIVVHEFAPNIGHAYIEALAGKIEIRLRLRRHQAADRTCVPRNPGRPARPHPRPARTGGLSGRRRHLIFVANDQHAKAVTIHLELGARASRPCRRTTSPVGIEQQIKHDDAFIDEVLVGQGRRPLPERVRSTPTTWTCTGFELDPCNH